MQVNLTQKERMLLEDQKKAEQLCIEKYTNYSNQTNDTQLKQIFNTNLAAEKQHLDTINQLLTNQMPNLNQQQNTNQMARQNNTQMTQQNMVENQNQQTTGINNAADSQMCSDLLTDEKFISGTYNTTIFECTDHNVRDVLNHIQKEEQEHGESIYKYMESKGMYNAK